MHKKNALNASTFILLFVFWAPCNAQKNISFFNIAQQKISTTFSFTKFLISIPINGAVFLGKQPVNGLRYLSAHFKNMSGGFWGKFSPDKEGSKNIFICSDIKNIELQNKNEKKSTSTLGKEKHQTFFQKINRHIKPVTATECKEILDENIICIDDNFQNINDEVTNAFNAVDKAIDDQANDYTINHNGLNNAVRGNRIKIKNIQSMVEKIKNDQKNCCNLTKQLEQNLNNITQILEENKERKALNQQIKKDNKLIEEEKNNIKRVFAMALEEEKNNNNQKVVTKKIIKPLRGKKDNPLLFLSPSSFRDKAYQKLNPLLKFILCITIKDILPLTDYKKFKFELAYTAACKWQIRNVKSLLRPLNPQLFMPKKIKVSDAKKIINATDTGVITRLPNY